MAKVTNHDLVNFPIFQQISSFRLESEWIELRVLAEASTNVMNQGLTSEFQLHVYCSVVRRLAARIAPSIKSRDWYCFTRMYHHTINQHGKPVLLIEAVTAIAHFMHEHSTLLDQEELSELVKLVTDQLQEWIRNRSNNNNFTSTIDLPRIEASFRAMGLPRKAIVRFADLIAADCNLLRAFCRHFAFT